MAKKVLFTSFKGGTGVSTCCVGIGLALAAAGERTLIVDGDNKSGSAMIISGCGNMQVFTLADYEKGACRAKQTVVSHPQTGNLCIAPSLGLKDLSLATQAVRDLDGLFDFILLDKIAEDCCDEAIIVTEPYLPSVKSADCCRSYLTDSGIKEVGLLVNKLSGGQILNGEIMTAQEIATVLHTPLKAVIPEDLTLTANKMRQSTQKAFRIAADAIAGKRDAVCNVLKSYMGINGFIKRKMREKI